MKDLENPGDVSHISRITDDFMLSNVFMKFTAGKHNPLVVFNRTRSEY